MKALLLSSRWAVAAVVMTACASETGATLCSEDRLREVWGTFPACCEDVGEDGHVYLYAKIDPAFGGQIVTRRYFDPGGTVCVNEDGSTECGCSTGPTDACEDEDLQCDYGPLSASADFWGDENSVVFVPRGGQESGSCGVDDNGEVEGGTHPPPASAQEYTGRQRVYGTVTGVAPDWGKCNDGVPGFVLTLRARCTGDVTGTISWGSHSVTCASPTGAAVATKGFWAALDESVQVEHSPTGWQGWGQACSGVGPCELSMEASVTVVGTFLGEEPSGQ